MPQGRYPFRCPFCGTPARRWALIEAQLASQYRSQAFACVSCGRLIEPDVRRRWLRLLVSAGVPVAFFAWALFFGRHSGSIIAAAIFAPVWSFTAAWLMPYFTRLRPAEQPATGLHAARDRPAGAVPGISDE